MSIVLNGTTGITAPDVDSTADMSSAGGVVVTDANIKTNLNATGTAPIYACRAFAAIDNGAGTGTPVLLESGNVSSITDIGSGQVDINFTTAMPTANFAVALGFQRVSASGDMCQFVHTVATTGAARIEFFTGSASADSEFISAAFFC